MGLLSARTCPLPTSYVSLALLSFSSQFDPVQKNMELEGICKCLVGQARSMGLKVSR